MPSFRPSRNNVSGDTITSGSNHQFTGSVFITGALFLDGVAVGGGGGSGDVTGPGSSTDNAIARFDGTGGKTLQNSGVTINDAGSVVVLDLTASAGVQATDLLVRASASMDTLRVSSSADQVLFRVDGASNGQDVPVLFVTGGADPNGATPGSASVGINTATPGSTLDVVTTRTGSMRILNDASKGFVIGHAAAQYPTNHVAIGVEGMPLGSYALQVAQDSGHTYVGGWDGNTVYIFGGGGNTGNSIAVHDYDATQRLELKSTNVFVSDGAYGAGATAGVQCQVSSSGNEKLLQVDGSTAGTILSVTGSGRVGIGTDTPSAYLHVSGAAANPAVLIEADGNIATPSMRIEGRIVNLELQSTDTTATDVQNFISFVSPSANWHMGFDDLPNTQEVGFAIKQGNNLGAEFYIHSDGNVVIGAGGVGASTPILPEAVLHVSSSGDEALFRVDGATAGNVLFVTGSGLVGIGTDSPTEVFEVNPNTDVAAIIGPARVGYNGYADTATFGHLDANTAEWALWQNAAGTTILNTSNAAAGGTGLYFRVNNTDKMKLTVDGDLGIGTTAPTALLHVSSSGDEVLLRVDAAGLGEEKPVLHVTGSGAVGIRTATPRTALDIHYSGSSNPTQALGNALDLAGEGGGEVVYFGTGSQLQSGSLMFLNEAGGWMEASADVTGSDIGTHGGPGLFGGKGPEQQLLGIPLSSSNLAYVGTMNAGILVKGYVNIPTSQWSGSFIAGSPVYINAGGNGAMSASAPTQPDEFVRIVGYCTDTANVIYFNPDSTYVEIEESE